MVAEVRMRRMLLLVLAGAFVSVVSGAARPAGSVQARWTITEFGQGEAVAVNDRGQVVGWDETFSGEGFIWQKGSIRHLDSSGGWTTSRWDIDDAGQVVGVLRDSSIFTDQQKVGTPSRR
jgi:probable HAF family extracellular repeat protein